MRNSLVIDDHGVIEAEGCRYRKEFKFSKIIAHVGQSTTPCFMMICYYAILFICDHIDINSDFGFMQVLTMYTFRLPG